jgi:hypothetical protein
VILLSFVLVVVSATALGLGVFQSSDPLIWTSLVAGLGAVALIVGSVLRRRRELVPGTVDAAGPATAGSVTVGSASAGVVPAPSPTPSRSGSPAASPTTDPVSPPGPRAQAPDRAWPWATVPPGGSPDPGSRSGWTGPVPAVRADSTDPPDRPDPAQPADGSAAGRPGGDSLGARYGGGSSEARPADGSAAAWSGGGSSEAQPGGGLSAARPGEGDRAAEDPLPPYAGAPVQIPADPVTAPGESPRMEQKASWDAAAEGTGPDGEPGIERVTVRDALRVAQLDDEVVVVDGHPRYHLPGCPTLTGAGTTPLAISVARRGGFTPCAVCGPDATFLARLRTRNAPSAD